MAEKVPNKIGILRVIEMLGGPHATWDELTADTRPELKNLKAGWIVGGYLSDWQTDKSPLPKGFKVLQDILASKLSESVDVLLPAAAWAEKDGCWENGFEVLMHRRF